MAESHFGEKFVGYPLFRQGGDALASGRWQFVPLTPGSADTVAVGPWATASLRICPGVRCIPHPVCEQRNIEGIHVLQECKIHTPKMKGARFTGSPAVQSNSARPIEQRTSIPVCAIRLRIGTSREKWIGNGHAHQRWSEIEIGWSIMQFVGERDYLDLGNLLARLPRPSEIS